MTVNFHALDGTGADTVIATMYVKNKDSAADLVKILYDPGVGTPPEGTLFKGWIQDKANYTTADAENGLDIGDIRTWAEGKAITDGEEVNFYAMFFNGFKVDYLDTTGVSLGAEIVLYALNETSAPYTVQKAYSDIDSEHHFVGWNVAAGASQTHIQGYTEGTLYPNGTNIVITGDVVFTVNAPEGHWLIFHEDHGTYVAPQFIYSDDSTVEPTIDMKKNGYTFGGWYDTEAHAAAHAADPDNVTTGKFVFGDKLTEKTDLYASWIPNPTAPYTIIFWTQNLDRTGYDVAGSAVVENGTVGNNIPYTVVENGDEDYATGTGFGTQGHYTGFNITTASRGQEIVIRPEGDSVLNLYFDRIVYNFRFYLYRDGTQNNRYDYANNSANGRDLNGLVSWHSNQTEHPSVTGYTMGSETIGGRTYHFFTMTAYYGQDISDMWPTYDKIGGANGRNAVSFVMMVGTALKPNPSASGDGTVKGVISVLNENILGATNNANGNYVVVRFPDSYYNWRYHIWYETVEGEDYTGKRTHTHNGITYYEETVMTVRSSNTTDDYQNEPKYQGFDYVTRLGQNTAGTVWQGGHWTTTEGGTTYYHLNYLYNRQVFPISYFDGNYIDGNNNQIQNRAEHLLHTSDDIPQGAPIPTADKNYVPTCPEEGYYFDGWYVDEACTVRYTFDKMPIGGIQVYAKWIKIQYRVFLHPNAEKDPNFDPGSEGQAWNFRISYGGQVSLPSMLRTESGYQLLGWYLDEEGKQVFNAEAYVLNETTVTTPYDKETTPTDPMDRWGDLVEGATPENHDINRPWITKQLDIYAVWRKVITGAAGIQVVYDANGGSNPPTDPSLYLDKAFAPAQAASTAPEDMVFSHWVVQKFNTATGQFEDTNVTVYPGETFQVLVDNAEKVANPDNTPEHPSYTYTIKVRAEYIEAEQEKPTFIHFYASLRDKNGDPIPGVTEANQPKDETTYHQNISINQPVDILSIEQVLNGSTLYDDYVFLGWAREPGGEPTGAKEAWLSIQRAEDGSYIMKDGQETYAATNDDDTSSTSVTKVAADEKTPYHNLYAVWEKRPTVTVTKKVTGNFGDFTKEFTFTISADQGFTYRTIKYVDGELTPSEFTATKVTTATVQLKNGESVTINAPKGAVITINEADYTSEAEGGYDKPVFAVSAGSLTNGSDDFTKTYTMGDTDATVTVTNNSEYIPDTGLALDSIPYVLLMGVVMICCFAAIIRRRRRVTR
ncbi:MAG: InlB B-repeat-containing protein [Clostridiales bacterium]|nr:InlB B-repeat-containing protein [Clostridiales bacterium]